MIPGLDRIDGTAVNSTLLPNDELWNEHTSELIDLFFEEQNSSSKDATTMVEFCADFAKGNRSTMAMRRARVCSDWKCDEYASKLLTFSLRTKARPAPPPPKIVSSNTSRRKSRNLLVTTTTSPSPTFEPLPSLLVPGVVLCCAPAFPYDIRNQKLQAGIHRLREVLSALQPHCFYFTPDYACHVTVATLQKFQYQPSSINTSLLDLEQAELTLKTALLCEAQRGPFSLIVDHVDITPDAVILVFREEERILSLRNLLRDSYSTALVPALIHCTVARVVSLPSFSRKDLLFHLIGIVENLSVHVTTMDLVVEHQAGYLANFPDGVWAHWNFVVPSILPPPKDVELLPGGFQLSSLDPAIAFSCCAITLAFVNAYFNFF